jgi:hypothetical protein
MKMKVGNPVATIKRFFKRSTEVKKMAPRKGGAKRKAREEE